MAVGGRPTAMEGEPTPFWWLMAVGMSPTGGGPKGGGLGGRGWAKAISSQGPRMVPAKF